MLTFRQTSAESGRCAPGIYTAGQHGAWAECGCGWRGPVVAGGAIGASVAWAMHVAELVSDRRGRRKGG